MSIQAENQQGMFHVSYCITQKISGQTHLGSATLRLNLVVNGPDKTVNGVGNVYQATNPPVNVISHLNGEWSYLSNDSANHVLIVLDGFDLSTIQFGGQPMESKNLTLKIAISEDWQTGSASFNYLYEGEWYEVEYALVELQEREETLNLDAVSSYTGFHKPSI
ncbi:DUF1842 domain-containing protein [Marinomonas sp. PE14-40]|uniref:DUF1842 domain-containing protein n=1 Tax=Marinomonas sp. PE14-40 TaxID=3060621 RepID=UPI003F67D922